MSSYSDQSQDIAACHFSLCGKCRHGHTVHLVVQLLITANLSGSSRLEETLCRFVVTDSVDQSALRTQVATWLTFNSGQSNSFLAKKKRFLSFVLQIPGLFPSGWPLLCNSLFCSTVGTLSTDWIRLSKVKYDVNHTIKTGIGIKQNRMKQKKH